MKNIAIIGGGASGLLAALKIKMEMGEDVNVTIFERNPRVGKKISLSGNGRGNISNIHVSKSFYNDENFVAPILEKYNYGTINKFFESLGLITKVDEEGRVYPFNESSNTVLDVIRLMLQHYGVSIVSEYVEFLKCGNQFAVGIRRFDYVLVCCGSIAGSNEKQNRLITALNSLGHSCTKLIPSLTPLNTTYPYISSLRGIKVKCEASLFINDELIHKENGEVLFKEKALSGIAIFNLSAKYARYTLNNKIKNCKVILDLFPSYPKEKLVDFIYSHWERHNYMSINDDLTGILNKMIILAVLKELDFENFINYKLNRKQKIELLVSKLKNWEFEIIPSNDYASAQVIVGGIDTNDINSETLESKKVNKLYFAGEVMNVDGMCGGFNLHFAFASGLYAADSIISSLRKETNNEKNK